MHFNLVLLRVCKHLLLLPYSYSLRVSAVLDHFGYPAPHLDQWQQHAWYDLGATQETLHQMHTRLSLGLPAITSPPRAESPPPFHRQAAVPIHPSHGGKFVKASKGENSAPSTASTRPSLPIATTSPKNGDKEKKEAQACQVFCYQRNGEPTREKEEGDFGVS